MTILSKRKKFSKLIGSVLDIPDPCCSLEDYLKYTNKDLYDMNWAGLWNERLRIELSLAILDKDILFYITPEGDPVSALEWLQARLKLLIDELHSNKTATGYKTGETQAGRGAAGWI